MAGGGTGKQEARRDTRVITNTLSSPSPQLSCFTFCPPHDVATLITTLFVYPKLCPNDVAKLSVQFTIVALGSCN